jgi:putative transposase
LTDAAWALIAPMLPAARCVGRPRKTNIRAVLNAIFYLLRTGCQWRLLPREFPVWSTVYHGTWRLRDFDAQKRVKGRKRHILVDTFGLSSTA